MKAFKVHNAEKVKQEVNLPAGTYTYSFRVIPVGTSYTFRLDNQSFTFEGLTAGVLNKRIKYTFELTETASFFYPSNTVGNCVYEPQIEEGVFATTPGAHPLDFERLISETGIEIDSEVLSLYAKKVDVSAEIKITADRIDSTVGNISNDIDGIKGDVTTISQTTTSIQSTVTNHTNQISTFQQTVNQIYSAIEDAGSGEFSSIIQRLDEIELKVGAPGQSGSIQVALNSIALIVYDETEGMSAINQKVGSITSTVADNTGKIASIEIEVDSITTTVTNNTGKIASIEITVDNIELSVADVEIGMAAIDVKVDSITSTVTNHTGQISTFQQTVDQIYSSIAEVGSGEFSSIMQRLDGIELKVGAPGKEGSIQLEVDSITTSVRDIDYGLAEVVVKVNNITSTVYDEHGALLSQISQDGVNVKISGSRIELEGKVITADGNFKILTDGSIEAKNGKFIGEVNATSGKIAGFSISGNGLSNGPLFNNNAYVIFRNDINKTFAGIGGNVLPASSGVTAVARFENRATNAFYGSTNYAMLVEASGANRNVAINVIGDIVMKGAFINVESTFGSIGYTNDITLRIAEFRKFLFYPSSGRNIQIEMPTATQLTSALGSGSMPSNWSIDIEIAVAYNAGGTIEVTGQVGGVIVDNDGNNASHNSTNAQGGVQMQKGDVLTLRFYSYSGRWLIVNHLK